MKLKEQGEMINGTYRVLKTFPFVIGTLYYTEARQESGIVCKRFVHALELDAMPHQVEPEEVLARDESVFFPVKEVFVEDGVLYQVFRRLEGNLLAHHLIQHSPLNLEETVWIARGIVNHLLRLYGEKQLTIIHPQNVLLTPGKAIRFLYGGAWGTLPKGLAPQVDQKTNQLVDSYTLGTLIYRMLTGKNPIGVGLTIPPISTYCKECPPELDEWIERTCSFDLHKRPTIAETADFLEWLAERRVKVGGERDE
ncbi:hypothetical protein C1X05_01085 [Laceyella sacchari]|uniref:Protein kinase domain-containing protein n=1 Tax=Laceyella tengchongensis TaxID=574699 RepID=A0AA45WRL7_9BACL|nr:hypothetical protein [Laceyella tengchongensis]AUS07588.1 hypothetical protein C1X05_01085 [Laceyella sacchari]SMP30662.1 hypothetical protein SAMN06265361_10791 [Laceyella tengchongensis]